MDNKNNLWVKGHSIYRCPRCLITVDPEQTKCFVCGYGEDDTAWYDDYYDRDYSGLLEDDL